MTPAVSLMARAAHGLSGRALETAVVCTVGRRPRPSGGGASDGGDFQKMPEAAGRRPRCPPARRDSERGLCIVMAYAHVHACVSVHRIEKADRIRRQTYTARACCSRSPVMLVEDGQCFFVQHDVLVQRDAAQVVEPGHVQTSSGERKRGSERDRPPQHAANPCPASGPACLLVVWRWLFPAEFLPRPPVIVCENVQKQAKI